MVLGERQPNPPPALCRTIDEWRMIDLRQAALSLPQLKFVLLIASCVYPRSFFSVTYDRFGITDFARSITSAYCGFIANCFATELFTL